MSNLSKLILAGCSLIIATASYGVIKIGGVGSASSVHTQTSGGLDTDGDGVHDDPLPGISGGVDASSLSSSFGSALTTLGGSLTNNGGVVSGTIGSFGSPAPTTVSYVSTDPSVCTVSGSTVTAVALGTCSITATISNDGYYNGTTLTETFEVTAVNQEAITLNSISWSGDGTASYPGVSGGSGVGGVTYSATGVCSDDGTEFTASGPGNCTITATRAASGLFSEITTTETVTVAAVDQASVAFDLSGTSFSGTTATLPSATGGSGSGSFSYAVASGPCTVSGSTLTATGIGTCSVTATKAGSGLYSDESASDDIAFSGLSQASLTASISGSTVSASGGSGSGAVTFAASPSNVCTISGSTITGVASGTCTVTATKASSGVYSSASATATTTLSLPLTTTSLDSNWKKITYSTSGGTSVTARRTAATSACESLGAGWALASRVQISAKASGVNQNFFSLPITVSYIASDCVGRTQAQGITTNACFNNSSSSKPWVDLAMCRKP